MDNVDIAIIGGGVVGASFACALSHLPLTIALFEAVPGTTRTTEDFDARSYALAYTSQNFYQALGLWPELSKYSTAITNIHVSNQGHYGFTRIQAQAYDLEALGMVVEAAHLQQVLEERLSDNSRVHTFCPAKVKSVQRQNDGAEICYEQAGVERDLKARLVVVADGARSMSREDLGIKSSIVSYEQTALVANIGLSRDQDGCAFERFTKQGPLALLPLGQARMALVWVQHADAAKQHMALAEADFLAQLQRAFGYRLGRFTRAGRRSTFPLYLVQAEQQILPHAVVLGNAAHSLHPVGGQGLNLSLRDVAKLAECLSDAVAREEDFSNFSVLQHYAQERQADQQRMTQLTHTLARIFANEWPGVSQCRNLGLLATDLCSPLKNALARHTLGEALRVPKLMCGLPLEGSL